MGHAGRLVLAVALLAGCTGKRVLVADAYLEAGAGGDPGPGIPETSGELESDIDVRGELGAGPEAVEVAADLTEEVPDVSAPDVELDVHTPEFVLEEGGFLWPCSSSEDCISTYCLVTEQYGTMCTVECDGGCPLDWQCQGLDIGLGLTFLCVPPEVDLCDPCEVHDECGAPGDLCLEIGVEAGKFCALSCADDVGCPQDYSCAEVEVDGDLTWQCLPASGSCVCLGELDGSVQPCFMVNEYGKCFGEMLCDGPYGWGECSASVPGPEVCNGLDDDCDGDKDEPDLLGGLPVPLCDDSNQCTEDGCTPDGGCQYAPLESGSPCPDTPGGTCVAGECVAG